MQKILKTKVAIIGGGPSGLFLSHILDLAGVDNIVLERKSKEYVLTRIRAGVLEPNSVAMLRKYGLAERMDGQGKGKAKDGTAIVWQDKDDFFIDTKKWTGEQLMAYGQTAITEDLYAARERDNGHVICEAGGVTLHDVRSDAPFVTFTHDGNEHRIDCDYIAGCDGFHGPSRQTIPSDVLKTYHLEYPFGWLGIMAEVPPLEEFIYAYHEKGFALAAQRNPMLSRYYVQVDVNDDIANWPDERFWEELLARFPKEYADKITTGPSIEKSIAPLRSFVAEPIRYGRLFLVGDAGHIVPPTGAKGLNLAFSDVHYLSTGLMEFYRNGTEKYLDSYAETALRRIWSSVNLSWRLTQLLHVFPGEDPFDAKIRQNNYDYLLRSEDAQRSLAREYIGLPMEYGV